MDKLLLVYLPHRRHHTGAGEEVDEFARGASGMGVNKIVERASER